MCKYCKRLEEVRKSDRENLLKAIRSHQRYERKLRKALKSCMISLGGVLACPDEDVFREAWNVLDHCSHVLFDKENKNG